MVHGIVRWLRHGWLDARDARRALPPEVLERLRARVAASERRHTGQIRLCVEGALPASYLWRHLREHLPMAQIVRQRALMMFSKLGVWDTERNNGVLVYLLLAERAIELVADRGVDACVEPHAWGAIVERLGRALHAGEFETGLTEALEEVSAVLVEHFPRDGASGAARNELPDEPAVF